MGVGALPGRVCCLTNTASIEGLTDQQVTWRLGWPSPVKHEVSDPAAL